MDTQQTKRDEGNASTSSPTSSNNKQSRQENKQDEASTLQASSSRAARKRDSSSADDIDGGDNAKENNAIQRPVVKKAKTSLSNLSSNNNQNVNDNDNDNTTKNNSSVVAITPLSATNKNKGEAMNDGGPARRLNNDESSTSTANKEQEQEKPATEAVILSSIRLPPAVPNVFSFPPNVNTPCQCCSTGHHPPHPCTDRCLGVDFLHTYGWEYKTLLRNKERQEYDDDEDDNEGNEEENIDPLLPMVASGIVPPLENRRREQTEWFSPRSINWDLDDHLDRQPDLAPRMRSILLDWIVELTEEYKLSPKTFHLAVTLIDKSLACTPSFDFGDNQDAKEVVEGAANRGLVITREMLQCFGCACTWIAAKIEEVVAPSVDDFVYISDNIYRREQIKDMEMDVCMTLKFRLQHVTPVQYAHEFLLASEQGPVSGLVTSGSDNCLAFHPILRNLVYYLLELSRFPYELIPVKPSLIAAAVLFLARATLGIRDTTANAVHSRGYWTKTLQYYTGYKLEELRDTVRIIHSNQRDAEESNLKAIFKKYNKAKFMFVSAKTVLNVEDIDNSCFITADHTS